MSINTQSLATEQALALMRSTELMLQQSSQQMSNQQTQCTDRDKVISNIEKPETPVKKGEKGSSSSPVSGEYAFLVAMSGMMETNLSVMGAQAKNMAALQPEILALNAQLSKLGDAASNCTGLSGEETLEQTTSINMQMSVVNAQLNNMTTSAGEDGSEVSTMASENNQNAGLAQSMLQNYFVRQAV